MTWLRVTSATLSDTTLRLVFHTSADVVLETIFTFNRSVSASLDKLPKDRLERLLHYIALGYAIYAFDYDYYDEIRTPLELTTEERSFFEDFYFNGMAEFRVENKLPITRKTVVTSLYDIALPTSRIPAKTLHGAVVANGGGKDGATAIEVIRSVCDDLEWFTWNLHPNRAAVIKAADIPSALVTNSTARTNATKKYKGHKPLNGLLAFLTTLAALISGKEYAVLANEYSANEANLTIDGVSVNHQYTKSFPVEQKLARLIDATGLGVTYFSILRPLYDLQIMAIFIHFPRYFSAFISCNRQAFEGKWCMECAKCAFVVLCVTALDPSAAKRIWGDDKIIARPELYEHIAALIIAAEDKPFECVGTLEECQVAAGMIRNQAAFFATLPKGLQTLLSQHAPPAFDASCNAIIHVYKRENSIPQALQPDVYAFFAKYLA